MNKDNRNYVFTSDSLSERDEYQRMASWIPGGSRVIDLGSGDGSLLALFRVKELKLLKAASRSQKRGVSKRKLDELMCRCHIKIKNLIMLFVT